MRPESRIAAHKSGGTAETGCAPVLHSSIYFRLHCIRNADALIEG